MKSVRPEGNSIGEDNRFAVALERLALLADVTALTADMAGAVAQADIARATALVLRLAAHWRRERS